MRCGKILSWTVLFVEFLVAWNSPQIWTLESFGLFAIVMMMMMIDDDALAFPFFHFSIIFPVTSIIHSLVGAVVGGMAQIGIEKVTFSPHNSFGTVGAKNNWPTNWGDVKLEEMKLGKKSFANFPQKVQKCHRLPKIGPKLHCLLHFWAILGTFGQEKVTKWTNKVLAPKSKLSKLSELLQMAEMSGLISKCSFQPEIEICLCKTALLSRKAFGKQSCFVSHFLEFTFKKWPNLQIFKMPNLTWAHYFHLFGLLGTLLDFFGPGPTVGTLQSANGLAMGAIWTNSGCIPALL